MGFVGDDFLSAHDQQWVGFSVEIGPDGAVYILDWHDSDICGNRILHATTDRVYRISKKGAKVVTLEMTNNGATWSGPVTIVGQAKGLRSQQAMFKTTVPDKEHHAVWLTIPGKKN